MLDPDIAQMMQAMQDNGEPAVQGHHRREGPPTRRRDPRTLLPAGVETRGPHRRAVRPGPVTAPGQ